MHLLHHLDKNIQQPVLGMAMKILLTGSRRVMEILNWLGHTIQELETELTFPTTNIDSCTPIGTILNSEQATGVTFDNFDRFVETLTGKDTLHSTVDIAYHSSIQQLRLCSNNSVDNSSADFKIGVKSKKNDQEDIPLEVEPIHKKRS